MMTKWLNKQITGIIAGFILPVIMAFLIYKFRYYGDKGFYDFLKAMMTLQSLGKLLSLSALPNLLLFFLAIWSERLLAARGVLIATISFGVVIVVLALIV
jgi:hypothetical protein